MKGTAKNNLPQKTCLVCGRPFSWRKKWERDWPTVKFCSDKCRLNKKVLNSTTNETKLIV